MGRLQDSSLKMVRLGPMSFTVCATEGYLAAHGEPLYPTDLRQHNCLCFRGRGRGSNWHFFQGDKQLDVPVSGHLAADCGNTLRYIALQDQGIIAMPTSLLQRELQNGRLKPLLTEWTVNNAGNEENGIYILYHPDRTQLQRIRAFIDFFKEPQRLIGQL